ncbi:hypothetical protein [Salinisphaera sp. T31B1]|uniref:hypothetical protein n=1 Tax=Salinisphaera sp. T31B1 TaxID=727963 RepID=UPI00333ECE00
MSDTAVRRFEFTRHGHSSRRDSETTPRRLLIGFVEAMRTIEYHQAGDKNVSTRPTLGVIDDAEFISGFTPCDAARIGAASERVRAEAGAEKVRSLRRIVARG